MITRTDNGQTSYTISKEGEPVSTAMTMSGAAHLEHWHVRIGGNQVLGSRYAMTLRAAAAQLNQLIEAHDLNEHENARINTSKTAEGEEEK